jgi:hypothetical protein
MNRLSKSIALSVPEQMMLCPTFEDMAQLLNDFRCRNVVADTALVLGFESASHSTVPKPFPLQVHTLLSDAASVRQIQAAKIGLFENYICPIHMWALASFFPSVKTVTRLVGKPYFFVSDCQVLVLTPQYYVWEVLSHGIDSVVPQFSKMVSLLPPLPD